MFLQLVVAFITSKSLVAEKLPCIPQDAHGVQRKVWSSLSISMPSPLNSLIKDPRYPDHPTILDYITTLEAPRRLAEFYGQTLTTYFVAPQTGNYVFYIACDDYCQLLVSSDKDPKNARVVINVKRYTQYHKWEGTFNRPSSPISMVEGNLYYIHSIMVQQAGGEHLSIGVKLPSGENIRPVTSNYLIKYPIKDVNKLTSLGSWGEWTACTKTCRGGLETRSRICLDSSINISAKIQTYNQRERRACRLDVPCPTPPLRIKSAQIETTHSSVKITWQPFAFKQGIITGYKIIYRSMMARSPIRRRLRRDSPMQKPYNYYINGSDEDHGRFIVPASYQSTILSGLKAFTKYCIQMATMTIYWESPLSACVNVTTAEQIPNLPPMNVTALNLTGPDRILVTWLDVPLRDQNGHILGYVISIHRLTTANTELQERENWTVKVNASDMRTILTGLQSYSLYEVRVAAFTSKGTGPYCQPVYAETCRCPQVLNLNWWNQSPSPGTNPDTGIFPTLVRNVIDLKCGFCHDRKPTVINFSGSKSEWKGNHSLLSESPLKPNFNEVLQNIPFSDISFPLSVEKGKNLTTDKFRFVPVLELAAGAVYINRKLSAEVYAKMVGSSVIQCWPILIVIAVMSTLAGIVLCIMESISYPLRTCYRSSFLKGVYEYTWCAFISMTTVGYGDRYPRSIQGRIFAIIWFIVGWILTCLFVSTLASSLCVKIVIITKNPIQGGKVGVVKRTPEHKIAMTINGTKGIQCIEYSNIDDMLIELKDEMIDGILLDSLSADNLNHTILPPSLYQVAKTFDLELNYGIGLSGDAIKLEHLFTEYVKNNPIAFGVTEEVKKGNQTGIGALAHMPETSTQPPTYTVEEKQINFFDPSNSLYKKTMYFTSGFLFGAIICGVYFYFVNARRRPPEYTKTDMILESKNVTSFKLISEQREMLKLFYLQCLTVANQLRLKHKKEQQLLLQKLQKQHTQPHCLIPLLERHTNRPNFPGNRTSRPAITHHREFKENNNTEVML